jgi:hypothetical protein
MGSYVCDLGILRANIDVIEKICGKCRPNRIGDEGLASQIAHVLAGQPFAPTTCRYRTNHTIHQDCLF